MGRKLLAGVAGFVLVAGTAVGLQIATSGRPRPGYR